MSTRAVVNVETLLKVLLVIAVAWIALQVTQWVLSGILATILFVAQIVIAVGFVALIVLWLTGRL